MNVAIATVALLLVLVLSAFVSTEHAVPRCAEDDMVVGIGQYSDGYWSQYVCDHDAR